MCIRDRYIEDEVFMFSSVVDKDPHHIVDLDDIGEIKTIQKDKIDYDFRSLGGKKVNTRNIKMMMERKYDVEVHSTDLILFPIWECEIKSKKDNKKRNFILDAVSGKKVIL